MSKRCIIARNAPPAVGPYSHAVAAGPFVFVSGMGPFRKEGGVLEENFEAQVRLTLDNLKTVLEEAGSGLAQVVKTTVYVVDMNEFPILNAIYQEYFPEDFPARTTIQASRLPKDIRVEVDAIAMLA